MRTRALVAVAVVLMGCPEMPATDGGTGGGTGGGSGGGNGGGSTSGGGTGGGSAGGSGGGAVGGGGGTTTGGGSGGVALDDYCAGQEAAQCAKQIRCGAATQGADCEKLSIVSRLALINARVDCISPATRASLASGRTIYDGVKAQQCFAALTTTSECTSTLSGTAADPSCSELLRGTVAQGQSCYGFGECAPGLYCDSSLAVCPGTCQPRVQAGGIATSSVQCELGLIPSVRMDGGVLCAAPVALGQSCAAPTGSFVPLTCAGANSCQSAADGGMTCQPYKTAGQACTIFAFNDCAIDHACTNVSDGGNECVPLGRSGQPCGVGRSCQQGLSCTGGVCAPLVAQGGVCGSDSDCVAGSLCKSGSCQPYGVVDAGCNTAPLQGDCGIGLFCNMGGRCEERRGLDVICTSGSQCSIELGLNCQPTDAGVSRCRPSTCQAP